MELATIELDNYEAVEESQLNRWRVFNGETWAHGFDSRERAFKFAERVGGIFIGRCEEIDGQIGYSKIMKV